jgi:prepilin-type N-terminal cleavage/methylation domain-containing protein
MIPMTPTGDDSGFTLAEFLIVVGLIAFILAAAYTAFTAVQTTDSSLEARSTQADKVGAALNQMSREIRQAQETQVGYGAFSTAQTQTISFYSNVDQDVAPELINYYVSNGALYKRVDQPSTSVPPYAPFVAGTPTVVIAQVNPSYTGNTFTYYTSTSPPVSTTDTSAISAVDIVLTGQQSSMTGPVNIRLESWVQVRSLSNPLN